MGEVVDPNASSSVPYGPYSDCPMTHDFTPLDPKLNENKYYCPGVGLVLVVDAATGQREEMVALEGP